MQLMGKKLLEKLLGSVLMGGLLSASVAMADDDQVFGLH